MSMKIDLNLRIMDIVGYEGEIEIEGEKYPFEVEWNKNTELVESIDWAIIPSKKLMIAERRITQLVSKVIKEDEKLIIV